MTAVILCGLNPFVNPGPLFFRQNRIGYGEKPFEIWKFRTLTGTEVPGEFAPHCQSRQNVIGRFLRHTHLDELPQIINLLFGEMTTVGPRPEQAMTYADLAKQIPCYRFRMMYRPGLTSPSQIKHGYARTVNGHAQRTRTDLEYFATATFRSNVGIIFHTIRYLLGLKTRRKKIVSPLVQKTV